MVGVQKVRPHSEGAALWGWERLARMRPPLSFLGDHVPCCVASVCDLEDVSVVVIC